MAKRKKTATKTVVVRSTPAKTTPTTIRIAAPASLARARKAGRKVYRKAHAAGGRLLGASMPQLTAIIGAGALGYCQKEGIKIPKVIDSLSTPANAGIIAFALGKFMKNSTLDHVATGCLSVALWGHMAGATVSGDDVLGGYPGVGVVYDDEY